MNLLLILLISYVTAEFDSQKCFAAFQTIEKITTLTQTKLKAVCTDETQRANTVSVLTDILSDCGLTDWSNAQNSRTQKKIGGLVDGLMDFAKNLLCKDVEGLYCFEGAIKILDVEYVLEFFLSIDEQIKSGKMPDFSTLDLKCTVLQDQGVIAAICPGGPRKSPKRKCQSLMVAQFQRAVRKIQRTLEKILPDSQKQEIMNLTMPLLNIAKDVKTVCNRAKRQATLQLSDFNCVGDTPPTQNPDTNDDDLPCVERPVISDACLHESDLCSIDPVYPACNAIARGPRAAILATKFNFMDQVPRLIIRDGSSLNISRAFKICCNEPCKQAIEAGNTCEKLKKAQNDLSIVMDGIDLPSTISSMTPAQQVQVKTDICHDKASDDGFNPLECTVEFYMLGDPVPIGRRLTDTTVGIGVKLTVNSTDSKPLSCESDGSLQSFDATISKLSNNTDSFSTYDKCNCTVGECFEEPENSEPTTQPSYSFMSSSESEGSSNSPENSFATNYSASFAMIFILFLFAKNA